MKSPILILHGWQAPSKKYEELKKLFSYNGYTVFCPDLPGFGDEPLKKPIMTLSDYVEFVNNYLDKKKISKVVIIGHSFGGRIAVKFSLMYPERVEKMVITGSPLIKRRLSFKKRFISFIAKLWKPIFFMFPDSISQFVRKALYFSIKEWDYYKSGALKETFKQIISEDLSTLLPRVSQPVLILWGEHDIVIPLTDGKKIASLIPNSQFIALPHASHKLPYEDPKSFFYLVHTFLSS